MGLWVRQPPRPGTCWREPGVAPSSAARVARGDPAQPLSSPSLGGFLGAELVMLAWPSSNLCNNSCEWKLGDSWHGSGGRRAGLKAFGPREQRCPGSWLWPTCHVAGRPHLPRRGPTWGPDDIAELAAGAPQGTPGLTAAAWPAVASTGRHQGGGAEEGGARAPPPHPQCLGTLPSAEQLACTGSAVAQDGTGLDRVGLEPLAQASSGGMAGDTGMAQQTPGPRPPAGRAFSSEEGERGTRVSHVPCRQ